MTNFPTCESCCTPIRARHTLRQFHTAIQRGCPDGIGDDVTPTIRRLEGGKDDHDNDNENKGNDTDLEAQRSEQKRKRVQFVSADTTMPALETPGHDASSDLNDESPAKRQRLHQHTESASTSMNILLAIPVPSPAPTAIGDESNDAGHDGKGADLDGRRGSGSGGEDTPLNPADPTDPTDPAAHSCQQLLVLAHSTA